jgi:hypothetical protein
LRTNLRVRQGVASVGWVIGRFLHRSVDVTAKRRRRCAVFVFRPRVRANARFSPWLASAFAPGLPCAIG